jgi:L-asparaginase II
MQLRIEVLVRRGGIVESRHRLQAALVTPGGEIRAATETPGVVTTFRSAAKPFQLLELVERGHADRWGFTPEELAVMSSSHTGSPHHLEIVAGILRRIGRGPEDLRCGFHEPLDAESRARLALHPEERSALYNNCSGKHAGMLALALSEGWPTEGYERLDHPVQQIMRRTIAEMTGVPADDVATAVDGCSVPVFGVPLSAMARSYARLADARPEGTPRDRALARIRDALRSFPFAVGGAQRFSTALMAAGGGRIVAKGGAEGLECVALLESRLGLAVKCEDGNDRAVSPAVIALLEHAGHLGSTEITALEAWRRPVLHNHAGLEVGVIEARLEACSPAAR